MNPALIESKLGLKKQPATFTWKHWAAPWVRHSSPKRLGTAEGWIGTCCEGANRTRKLVPQKGRRNGGGKPGGQ